MNHKFFALPFLITHNFEGRGREEGEGEGRGGQREGAAISYKEMDPKV